MPTNETGLVKAIRAAIERRYPGAWTFKVHGGPYQEVGVPDLFVGIRGKFIAMEVKFRHAGESEEHARERVSNVQWAYIQRLRAVGFTAGAVLSVEEALALVREALAEEGS